MIRAYIRPLFLVLMVLFTAGCLIFILANTIVVGSTSKKVFQIDDIENLDNAQCVLVLGAHVYSENSLSAVLQDRVDYAIAIYNAGKAERILFSGDHGRTEYDEVNAMLNYAVDKGVPEEDIFLDHAGFSTYESMYRASAVFCASDLIVVTQEFHIYRAVYIADAMGLNVQGVSSDPRRYLHDDYNDIRESLARVKDFVYVIMRPEPTYLGEEIPITGNSSLTHDK